MNDKPVTVSPNNPCPFLRALVAEGMLDNKREPLTHISNVITKVGRASDTQTQLPFAGIYAVALIANGIGPLNVLHNQFNGVRLNALRNGPLDKKGSGSRILNAHAQVQTDQLDRLRGFASEKTDAKGNTEPGLSEAEITRFMDENFARAKGDRRAIDRKLMNAEWPVLLKVLGKMGIDENYLAVDDVEELFRNRRLPSRMIERLKDSIE